MSVSTLTLQFKFTKGPDTKLQVASPDSVYPQEANACTGLHRRAAARRSAKVAPL